MMCLWVAASTSQSPTAETNQSAVVGQAFNDDKLSLRISWRRSVTHSNVPVCDSLKCFCISVCDSPQCFAVFTIPSVVRKQNWDNEQWRTTMTPQVIGIKARSMFLSLLIIGDGCGGLHKAPLISQPHQQSWLSPMISSRSHSDPTSLKGNILMLNSELRNISFCTTCYHNASSYTTRMNLIQHVSNSMCPFRPLVRGHGQGLDVFKTRLTHCLRSVSLPPHFKPKAALSIWHSFYQVCSVVILSVL